MYYFAGRALDICSFYKKHINNKVELNNKNQIFTRKTFRV